MAIDLKTEVVIRTTIEWLNVALLSMGQRPYDDVAPIIADWKQQALEQLAPPQAPPAASTDEGTER